MQCRQTCRVVVCIVTKWATSRSQLRSVCSNLIGRKYSYGDNDCIHLVFDALDQLEIKNPGVQSAWYEMTPKQVLGELNRYCDRVEHPSYDGDRMNYR